MHFGTLKISVFIEIGLVFRLKSAIFFNVDNTDGLHKSPVSGGTGTHTLRLNDCCYHKTNSGFLHNRKHYKALKESNVRTVSFWN